MQFFIAAGLTLCLAPSVFSSAIPVPVDTSPALDKRVVPITPPQGTVTCLGYGVAESAILAAINQGTAWATTSPPTQMGSSAYPHIYNNYESLTFPNCAGVTSLWEYPVLRYGANPWVPSKNTKMPTGPNNAREPDRVIFAPASADSVTYCGMITHDPTMLTNTGKLGAFVLCTV
ncbi:hypothetical protein HO173_003525 [Letharia columbiana]|uniref:Uncharacterized protein n=1 Tax=Letharia columbiana TaxID=112416 RepID=A0A8H6G0J1_9LECA|nr:uncharacterized protein HO173_003525 [Letharia columbiana]KAF6238245.1 hypothetical protein HO173_003525 [Letharia columbiana]